MFIFSHNKFSQGAKKLAEELGCRLIRHENSRFTGQRAPWVVNWGYPGVPLPWMERVRLLNAPRVIERVSNKLTFFQLIHEANWIPKWAEERHVAEDWARDGKKVVCRTLLNASGGRGIVIASTVDELVDAPLYVQYIPKKSEYRVHIFDGEIIDIQQKVSKAGGEPLDWKVRSHANGFIYQRANIHPPASVCDNANGAMAATDLHFGAVDVIYNEKQDRAYVLEINTAPGLEGQTVQSYARAIREYIE